MNEARAAGGTQRESFRRNCFLKWEGCKVGGGWGVLAVRIHQKHTPAPLAGKEGGVGFSKRSYML